MTVFRIRRFTRALVLCVFSALLAGLAFGKGMEDPERYLPADTAMVITIPDLSAAKAAWGETATGQMWADPAMDYWRALRLAPAIDATLTSAGLQDMPEVMAMAEGQLTIALELPDLMELPADAPAQVQWPDAALYLMVDFGENAPKARRMIESHEVGRIEYPVGLNPKMPYMILHTPAVKTGHAVASAWVDETWVVSTSGAALRDLLSRRLNGNANIENRRNVSLENLDDSDVWKAASKHFVKGAAAHTYVDYNRVMAVAFESLDRNAALLGHTSTARNLTALIDTLGMRSMLWRATSIEIRGKAFCSRSVTKYDPEGEGYLVPELTLEPVEALDWFTEGNYAAFSAASMKPPIALWQSLDSLGKGPMPRIAVGMDNLRKRVQFGTGLNLDRVIGAFGDQYVSAQHPSSGQPDMALMWKMRDYDALQQALDVLKANPNFTTQSRSYKGYVYEQLVHQKIPAMPFYIMRVDDWFMFATQDAWLKNLIDRRQYLAMTKDEREAVESSESVRVMLNKPFRKTRNPVSTYIYSDMKPSLISFGKMLPVLPTMVNLNLKQMGMPTVPGWMAETLPPLVPIVKQVFPTQKRISQDGYLTIEESYSAFDPIASPLAATVFVIGQRYLEEQAQAQTITP